MSEPPDTLSPDGPGDGREEHTRWDANDPRRQKDCFAPPTEPCECHCLHCGRTFMSDQIWLQRVVGGRDGFEGFWMCPTPNCGGAGFTFDIFPTDPDHPANEGWHDADDDEDDLGEDAFDEQGNYIEPENRVYNPAEPKFKSLDEELGEQDDDIEGEEWKFGLEPGQRPAAAPPPSPEAQQEFEEEQRRYNEPDQRPREINWTDRELTDGFNEDDIPF
jgi:hypothetical protein